MYFGNGVQPNLYVAFGAVGAVGLFVRAVAEPSNRWLLASLVVDLFLLAHSNKFIVWVAELPPARRAHLRLVYNTGCGDLPQGPSNRF